MTAATERADEQRDRQPGKKQRTKRVPVFQQRGGLYVDGKDKNYVYRWVEDDHESGNNIVQFIDGGYEFATRKDVGSVGENYVFESEFGNGSIIRKPASKRNGGWMYLLRIKRQWYEEDQRAKQKEITSTEKTILRTGTVDGEEIEGGYDPKSVKRRLERD